MQPGSSVQKQVESGGESIHRTGFSREQAGSFTAAAASAPSPSRLKPVLRVVVAEPVKNRAGLEMSFVGGVAD